MKEVNVYKCIVDGEWDGYTYTAPSKEEAIQEMKAEYLRNAEYYGLTENIKAINDGTMVLDAEPYGYEGQCEGCMECSDLFYDRYEEKWLCENCINEICEDSCPICKAKHGK